jgi:catechol 2,3-dioxygenase-like lactoylglutathione lyase family enzyme
VELDHVQLAAPPGCEAAARRFFGEILGLTELVKPTPLAGRGGAWFALGDGRQLHIGVVPASAFTPSVAHPGFRVTPAELDRLAAALAGAGHPVSWATPGEIPGYARFHTTDPWGNRLEFLAAEPVSRRD